MGRFETCPYGVVGLAVRLVVFVVCSPVAWVGGDIFSGAV
jgi:hypothetical protein